MNLASEVLLVLLSFIIQVESKYCYYTDGELTKYYYCSGYEYCCTAGCCEGFISFYRLWYFWIGVILLLMFCSGGGFYYRKRYLHHRMMVDHTTPIPPVIAVAGHTNTVMAPNPVGGHLAASGNTSSAFENDKPPSYSQLGYPAGPYPNYPVGQEGPYPNYPVGQEGLFPVVTQQGIIYSTGPNIAPPSYETVSQMQPPQGLIVPPQYSAQGPPASQ